MAKSESIVYIKGIAIIMIIFSHCYSLLGVKSGIINSYFDDMGRLGVLFFITITGVLTTSSYRDCGYSLKKSLNNVHRKIRPMYGEYLFFLIIMFVLYIFKYRKFNTIIVSVK
jgi:peptidoglycan/LPS O-acetylase OafA/YrhL